jgi:hypothetical protein
MVEIFILLVIASVCFLGSRLLAGVSDTKTTEAKQNYETALKNGNRMEALKWGRIYFASLRWHNGYNLTIYDEQRIQNDINVHCK